MYPSVWPVKPFNGCKEVTSRSPMLLFLSQLDIIWCALDCVWSGLCFFVYGKQMGLPGCLFVCLLICMFLTLILLLLVCFFYLVI